MREILFRGKRVNGDGWVYGDLSYHVHDGEVCYVFAGDGYESPDCYEVDPATVGQYTGLTDKNGTKIFEGDVVQALTPQKGGTEGFNIGTVEFHKSAFSVEWSNFLTYGRSFIGYFDNIEVIGNIHENHELLSKEKSQC